MNPDPRSPTWENLVEANPSLQSWLRSAPVAGGRGLLWWPQWAAGSSALRRDVSAAVGASATTREFWEAHGVALQQITAAYDQGRQAAAQAQERTRAEARRQATAAPRRQWRAWT